MKSLLLSWACLFLVFSGLCCDSSVPSGHGQPPNEAVVIAPITATEEAELSQVLSPGDRFGFSVALDGEIALVSAPGHTPAPNLETGLVYGFFRGDSGWEAENGFLGSEVADNDLYGQALALDGNLELALVGAPFSTVGADAWAGVVYVFSRIPEGFWLEDGVLTADDADESSYFGTSVSLDGDRALVGSLDDEVAGLAGAVYVFVRSAGGLWSQEAKLTIDHGGFNEQFGSSVSLDGDRALIGAARDGELGNAAGAAYIFERTDEGWSLVAQLLANDGEESDRFGWRVSLDGDRALVGADQRDAAYVFVRSGDGTWSQEAKLQAEGGSDGDRFGCSVSLSGETALIGAMYEVDGDQEPGAAYLFARGADGIWRQEARLSESSTADLERYGSAVSLDGTRALVGASNFGAVMGPEGTGRAFVYTLLRSNGLPCSEASECESGFCASGVCCNSACTTGNPDDCLVCSVAAGGDVDGHCTILEPGTPCGSGPTECASAGFCEEATGFCVYDPEDEGTACGDEPSDCVVGDTCNRWGDCIDNGFAPLATPCGEDGPCATQGTCAMDGQCSGATYSPGTVCGESTGQCDAPEICVDGEAGCPADDPTAMDGQECDDGRADTFGDHCQGGACVGEEIIDWEGTCADPLVFADASFSDDRSSAGHPSSIFSYQGCDGGEGLTSGDVVYLLELQAGSTVSAEIDGDFDMALALVSVCDEAADCLGLQNEGGVGERESLHHMAQQSGAVYLVVDGRGGGGRCGADDQERLDNLDVGTAFQICSGRCQEPDPDAMATCISACFTDDHGLTQPCSQCFGDYVFCYVSQCGEECTQAGDHERCSQCLEEHCQQPFSECLMPEDPSEGSYHLSVAVAPPSDGDGDADSDADADADAEADGDADADSDADSDGDADADADSGGDAHSDGDAEGHGDGGSDEDALGDSGSDGGTDAGSGEPNRGCDCRAAPGQGAPGSLLLLLFGLGALRRAS